MSGIILAADGLSLEKTFHLARAVSPLLYAIKIHDLYDAEGPRVVETLKKGTGCLVMVDFKLHDIPTTVRLRARALASSGADILTVHGSGGRKMLEAALEGGVPEVFGVTVLTSLDKEEVRSIYGRSARVKVPQFARLANSVGLHGVVCSPKELDLLAKDPDLAGLKRITPGVRSPGAQTHDQSRFDTPRNAARNGASIIVLGRQITEADDPVAAIEQVVAEMSD